VAATYSDDYLQKSIDGAFLFLSGEPDVQTMRPHHTAPTDTIAEAQASVLKHAKGFMDRTLDRHRLKDEEREAIPPENAAIVVTVGGGKTTKTQDTLPLDLQARGVVFHGLVAHPD
jgi:hypothetical protein